VPLVAGFNVSAALADNHIGTVLSKQLDCLHYCHPGVPEVTVNLSWGLCGDGVNAGLGCQGCSVSCICPTQ
jgi:hypothetical protein